MSTFSPSFEIQALWIQIEHSGQAGLLNCLAGDGEGHGAGNSTLKSLRRAHNRRAHVRRSAGRQSVTGA
ncbi:uncharacterized protein Dvir_GJ26209 [Drosophila virilis]|uniref:Uncharacterized protein n=1 Tax=Drosophila virilis TaxID=7244 RepID=A0A0Q9W8R0_DROVI|nr:uncharacterized protein Dvir_GJ26209 [Drosophila virilis]